MFGSLGPLELMIIFVIVLVVFGADRLPELARGLGKGIREFKRAADDVKREIMIDTDLNLDLDLDGPLTDDVSKAQDPYKHNDFDSSESQPASSVDTKNVKKRTPAKNKPVIKKDKKVVTKTEKNVKKNSPKSKAVKVKKEHGLSEKSDSEKPLTG